MNSSVLFLYSFFSVFTLSVLIKIYLLFRNINSIQKNLNQVPTEFQDIITLQQHNKAQNYTLEKNILSITSIFFNAGLTLLWLFGGGLSFLEKICLSLSNDSMINKLVFLGLFFLINSTLSLPFSLYSTFKIEEKYGFNKTSWRLYFIDLIKSSLFSIILMIPILWGILYIYTKLGTLWWIYAWIALTAFQLFIIWAYPKFISPFFNKFTPLDNNDLSSEIDKLCERTNISFKEYFIMDASRRSSHGNAYFTGFGKNKRIVFFDTLIESLSTHETIAVLAHELGHFQKKHIQKSMFISSLTLLTGLYLLSWLGSSQFFYDTFLMNKSSEMSIALFMIIIPYYTFFTIPIKSKLSRKNEFEADEFAAKNADASDLIDALLKMYKDNSSSLTPDSLYSKFYFSHPPAKERISFLKRYL